MFEKGEYLLNEELQSHAHEIQGSVIISEVKSLSHTHTFKSVTSDFIQAGDSHYHEVKFISDTVYGHNHEFRGCTAIGKSIWDNSHLHSVKGFTSLNDKHRHEISMVTNSKQLGKEICTCR